MPSSACVTTRRRSHKALRKFCATGRRYRLSRRRSEHEAERCRMKTLSTDGFVARLLDRLAWAVIHRQRWFLYPQIILCFVCIVYTVRYLQFDTSRNDLVGANKRYHQNFLKFKKEFPTQDDLVVVVESGDAGKNRQFVERLGAKLE